MKKWIIFGSTVALIVSLLCACGSQPVVFSELEEVNTKTQHRSTETAINDLYKNAMNLLSELDDPRIDDFKIAYELLMSIPDNKDGFLNQLDEVSRIFEKYNVDLKYGGWYLQPYLSEEAITNEGMDEYRAKNVYWDTNNLMQAIVYPVLFDTYGSDAQHIEGLVASDVIAAIEATCDYSLEDKVEDYDGCTETWEYIGTPKCDYEIRYHNNGLVESVNIPIIRSDVPMNDADFSEFFTLDLAEQKQFAGERFANMIARLNTIFTGYEVLSQIYTDEEINIICNYIKSLTIDEIWEKNMWEYSEPLNYAVAAVSFVYKGNDVTIHYGLNGIYLRINSRNYVNQLSSKWYILYCGLVLPDGSDDIIQTYQDYVDYNIAANDIIYDWSFDLDSNAHQYVNSSISDDNDTKENDTLAIDKIVVSMIESITVEGTIEQNVNAFPQYYLRLSTPITIAFKEYGDDYEFECEYLYFYDDTELNGGYDFTALTNQLCTVTALLEDYRGGSKLYFLNPTIDVE